jgi:uncharacterized surface protein with fasciclin (FAS1) repeats
MKRLISAATTADKVKALLTSDNDKWLKETAPEGEVYDHIFRNLKSRAAHHKVVIPSGWGVKPAPVLVSIAETAAKAGSFKTLLAAATAAGLDTVLAGAGTFTVFAPTDAAFAALPEGTVEGLLADKEKLTAVLTYHVLPTIMKGNKVGASKVALDTVNETAKLSVKNDKTAGVTLGGDDCKIVTKDIRCSNGIIHVIDKVLIPK